MNAEIIKNYKKAGSIAARARDYAYKIIDEGASYLQAVERIENKIISLGGLIAFPANISINQNAAHDTARINDERIFKEGDLVKIDIGVHVNGCIGDTAITKEVRTNNWQELIKSCHNALEQALKITKKGTSLRNIGRVIEQEIRKKGFNPIMNLGGHPLEEYQVHGDFQIPNYDNNDKGKLDTGVVAVEPFATNGEGMVNHSSDVQILNLASIKPTRLFTARKILDYIKKNYATLPFAKRWILKKFPNSNLALMQLVKEGILHQYPVLKEKSGGMVAQEEHTIIILDDKTIITTRIK